MSQPTRPRWAGGCRRSPFQFQGRPNSRTPARCARWVSRIPVPTRWVSRIPLIRWVSHIPRIPGLVGVPYSAPSHIPPRTWVSRIHVRGCPVFTYSRPVSRYPLAMSPVGVPYSRPVLPHARGCPVFTPSRIHATQRLAPVPDPSGRRPSVIFLSRSGLILRV